jgi:hypothetical protein
MKEIDKAVAEPQPTVYYVAPLFKVTKHPIKKDKTPGKSSGVKSNNKQVPVEVAHQNQSAPLMDQISAENPPQAKKKASPVKK